MSDTVINTGPNARFVGGRLVEVGEEYNPELLNPEVAEVANVAAGQLSVSQLEALLAAKRGNGADDVTRQLERNAMRFSTGEDVQNPDVFISSNGPAPKPEAISKEEIEGIRTDQGEEADAKEAARLANLDRDGNGDAGGSRSKAEIAAELTELGVEFDGRASRDSLDALLTAEKAKRAEG